MARKVSEDRTVLTDFELTGDAVTTTFSETRKARRGYMARSILYSVLGILAIQTIFGLNDAPWIHSTMAQIVATIIAAAVCILPGLPRLLRKPFIRINHSEQTIETKSDRRFLYEAVEIQVRENYLQESRSNWIVFLCFKTKRRVALWRSLREKDARALAAWLVAETGLPVRIENQ